MPPFCQEYGTAKSDLVTSSNKVLIVDIDNNVIALLTNMLIPFIK